MKGACIKRAVSRCDDDVMSVAATGVREMMFATDKNGSRDGEKSLSVSEYIAIGVCILLLGLIYVASLFLYFYFRRKKKKKSGDGAHLTVAEEGNKR